MKYIKPMNCEEFAQYLLTLKNGDTVEFGCDPGVSWPDEVPDIDSVEAWYFARVIHIPEYTSRFILIDYAGGESAYAIPLNCYKNECDGDDAYIVPQYVKEYFKRCCPDLAGEESYVFVEMEEE
jgi:hypothetical protein